MVTWMQPTMRQLEVDLKGFGNAPTYMRQKALDLDALIKGLEEERDEVLARFLAEERLEPEVRVNHDLIAAVAAAKGKMEVYLDGGIRRGADVVKALALGAKAVFIGRPLFWGLAVGGEQGVIRVLDILREEIEITMAKCGRPTIADIDASVVVKAPPL